MTYKVLANLAKRWRQETRGNVAIIFALSVIPILSIVGVAIDTQMTMTHKNKVQAVIDSAVIYGSREMQDGANKAKITKSVNTYVKALLKEQSTSLHCTGVALEFSDEKQDINAAIFCSNPTTLSNIFGQTKMDFWVRSGSTYGIGKVDVAFIFDVSGSMRSNGKMEDLKKAAREAVDTLMPPSNPDDIRIGMVSYDTMVNAGDYFEAVTGQKPRRTVEDTTIGWEEVCVRWNRRGTRCRKSEWQEVETTVSTTIDNTCVKERIGAEAFTDAAPGPGQWLEAAEATYDASRHRWTEETCNDLGPQPLTNNRGHLVSYINHLDAYSSTAGHMGVAWGWYLLAPTWNSVWPSASKPLPYDEPDSTKAMILMTDGEFNKWFATGQGNSFQQAQKMCDAAKAEHVVIYTVAFQAPKQGEEILNYCATSPGHAFKPSNGQELTDAYSMIAQSISDLRITY